MKVKKTFRNIAQYLPQVLVLLSVLTSNIFFPAVAIAEEISNLPSTNTQVEEYPIDESEDILEDGISTSIYEEDVVVEEADEPLFVYEDGVYTVFTVVEGEEYVYPDNSDVRITFNEVTEEGNLVIERVGLTDEQREELNTTDVYGWDISSTMSNGSFEYDLTLPNTQGSDVEVKYTEDGSNYESVNTVNVSDGIVELRGLDHFTTFVVSGVDNSGSCTGASITEPSGTTACYTTIQEAVNNASIGDTIYVSSGTHTLNSQLVISKDLTIVGDDKENTKIVPNFNTTGWNWDINTNSLILINNDATVSLSDITIDGIGHSVAIAVRVDDANSFNIEDAKIENIRHTQYFGFGITFKNSKGNVTEVSMENIERVGIESQFNSDINVNNFVYIGKGEGDWLDYGLEVGRGGNANVDNAHIKHCVGNAAATWSSAGIYVTTAYGLGSKATIENSIIEDNTTGIYVGYGDTDTSVVTTENNSFKNNNYQIHVSSGDLDLEYALENSNFDKAVVVRENPIKVATIYSSIQDAIDHADDGDIIQVLPGTYNENISIDKGLSLIGEDRDTTIISPTSGKVIDIKAQTYTIDGLTIQGFTLLPQDASIALQSNSGINNGFDGSNYLYKDLIIDENDFAQSAIGLFDVDTVTLDNVVVMNSTRTTGGAIEIVGVKDFTMINSKVIDNEIGLKVFSVSGYENNSNFEIHNSTFENNSTHGILNDDSGLNIDATNNWWGHITGPSGANFGKGDKVSNNVDICPWLKSEDGDPVETCEATRPIVTITSPENGDYISGEFDVVVEAEDNWGMGSYYIRLWENGPYVSQGGTVIDQCSTAPGGTNLGLERTDTCTFDSTSLVDGGDYYITAQYQNTLVKWGKDQIQLNIDNTKPVVELTSIEKGEFYQGTIDFRGTSVEENPESYRFYLRYLPEEGGKLSVYNSGWLPLNTDLTDKTLYEWDSTTSIYGDGTYRVRFDVRDKAGNWKHDLIDIEVDNTSPIGTISYIYYPSRDIENNYFVTNDNTPILGGDCFDENLDQITLDIDGQTQLLSCVGGEWISSESISALNDGEYNSVLTLIDKAGNRTEMSQELYIDTTPPNAIYKHYKDGIEIQDPIAFVRNLSQLTFKASYNDPYPSSGLYQDSFVIFEAQDDGSFRFSANDKKSYCSWRKSPNLVNSLTGRLYELTDPIPFTNCVSELPEGEYYMAHQVYDHATRQDIPTIYQFRDVLGLHFVVDRTEPVININPSRSPDIGNWYSTRPTYSNTYPTFEIFSMDTDVEKIEYKWNDGAWNEYIGDILYEVNGKHTLYARATDFAGNVTEEELEVWFDFSNPEGTFTIDDSDGLVRETIKLSFTGVEDPSGSEEISRIEIWVDGYKGSATKTGEGTYEYLLDTTELNDGDYTIRPSIFDIAGNRTRPSINITVDNTAPEESPTIVFPNENDYFNTTPILNDWTKITDENGIKHYRIEYVYDDNHSFSNMPYRYTTSTQRNHTPGDWEEGGVKFRVQGIDNAGNEGPWSGWRHYYFDQTAPQIPSELYYEANEEILACNSYTSSYNIIAEWEDSTDDVTEVSHYEYQSFNPPTGWIWTDNNPIYTSKRPGAFTVEEGTYGFRVRAVDMAGNKSDWSAIDFDSSCKITYDATKPTSPENLRFEVGEDELSCGARTNIENVKVVWDDSFDNISNSDDIKYLYEVTYTDPETEQESTWTTTVGDPHFSGSFAPKGEGLRTIRVKSIDQAGNESKWSLPCSIFYDITDPEVLFANQSIPEILFELPEYSILDQSEELIDEPVCTVDEGITFPVDAESEDSTFEVTCTYSDTAGNSNTSTYTITVTDVPISVILSADDTEVLEGDDPVILSTTVTGGNDPHSIAFSGDCANNEDGTATIATEDPGEYTCTVEVTDADGDTDSDQISVSVGAVLGEATDNTQTENSTGNQQFYASNLGTGAGNEVEEDLEITTEDETNEEEVLGEERSCENPVKVYGYIYHDKDTDGEIDDNEDRLEDISLRIYYMENGEEMTVVTLQTDEDGYWETELCPGTYTLEVDQEDIPEDLVLGETHEIVIEEDTEEYRLDLGATEDRNFWQKYWYLIVIGAGILVTITYLILSKGKKEETYQ